MKTSENKLLIFISIIIVIALIITAVHKLSIRDPYPDNSLWQEMFESQRKIDSLRHVLDYYITLHSDTVKVPPIYELYESIDVPHLDSNCFYRKIDTMDFNIKGFPALRRINVPPIDSNNIFRYQH